MMTPTSDLHDKQHGGKDGLQVEQHQQERQVPTIAGEERQLLLTTTLHAGTEKLLQHTQHILAQVRLHANCDA